MKHWLRSARRHMEELAGLLGRGFVYLFQVALLAAAMIVLIAAPYVFGGPAP